MGGFGSDGYLYDFVKGRIHLIRLVESLDFIFTFFFGILGPFQDLYRAFYNLATLGRLT